ncbi:hypothetical protein QQG30_26335, partial [Klebsiella pneumoniae]|uniref:hypothetical protein n=2 Tax=Klebsiella pneumoniae TaxID=573 RepID=UPI001AB006E5
SMSGLDNCPAITNDNHYLMGPPGGVAFHGAARSRESAGFLDPWSSSSFAQVVDFIDACFAMMSKRLKSVHHHGSGNRFSEAEYQSAGGHNQCPPSDSGRQAEKC